MSRIDRRAYVEMYGPTTGDRVRLRARVTTVEGEVLEAETEAPLGPGG